MTIRISARFWSAPVLWRFLFVAERCKSARGLAHSKTWRKESLARRGYWGVHYRHVTPTEFPASASRRNSRGCILRHFLEDPLNDMIGSYSFGFRFEIQDQPVAQCPSRDRLDIFKLTL